METWPIIVDVPTDAEAMLCAAAIAKGGAGAEVWDMSRLVCRVPAPAPRSDPASAEQAQS